MLAEDHRLDLGRSERDAHGHVVASGVTQQLAVSVVQVLAVEKFDLDHLLDESTHPEAANSTGKTRNKADE